MPIFTKELNEFEAIVDLIYGTYLDSKGGFRLLIKEITEHQEKQLENLKQTRPHLASMEFLDSTPRLYCEGDPNVPGAGVLHQCSLREYKERNSETGTNARFIGNMSIIAIYQYWEDHFREKIADALGRKKNDISSPIMGDLRLLRQSIVHHRGVALNEIKNCQLLKWFSKDDQIMIDEDKFKEIVFHIKSYITTVTKQSISSKHQARVRTCRCV